MEQVEETRFRPTVQLTISGEEVMRERPRCPGGLRKMSQFCCGFCRDTNPRPDIAPGGPLVRSLPVEAECEQVPVTEECREFEPVIAPVIRISTSRRTVSQQSSRLLLQRRLLHIPAPIITGPGNFSCQDIPRKSARRFAGLPKRACSITCSGGTGRVESRSPLDSHAGAMAATHGAVRRCSGRRDPAAAVATAGRACATGMCSFIC